MVEGVSNGSNAVYAKPKTQRGQTTVTGAAASAATGGAITYGAYAMSVGLGRSMAKDYLKIPLADMIKALETEAIALGRTAGPDLTAALTTTANATRETLEQGLKSTKYSRVKYIGAGLAVGAAVYYGVKALLKPKVQA